VLIPGTGVLFTIATGLFKGKRASMVAALGCTLGIMPSLLASILGLALIIHTSALAFQILKYAGVAYLLFLSFTMLRSNGITLSNENQGEQPLASIALKGFLINILNPKLTVFFLAFLPQFVPPNSVNVTSLMLLYGGIFMAITFAVFIGYGLLANSVRDYVLNSEKLSIRIQRVFAGSFATLGLKLAFTQHE
jgi:threonine/homoserine/homoserine lactone efflux protein